MVLSTEICATCLSDHMWKRPTACSNEPRHFPVIFRKETFRACRDMIPCSRVPLCSSRILIRGLITMVVALRVYSWTWSLLTAIFIFVDGKSRSSTSMNQRKSDASRIFSTEAPVRIPETCSWIVLIFPYVNDVITKCNIKNNDNGDII